MLQGASMSRYRVGIIGLGRISSTIDDEVQGHPAIMLPYAHTACFREVADVEVVAGADPFEAQREAFGERWGIRNLYADYREMVEREKLDIVSVATSAKPRPGIVQIVAAMGVRAIYAEKPIAFTLAEADAMVRACAEHNIVLAIGCTRRWDPWWAMARQMIADNQIGNVLQVNAHGDAAISHNGSHLIDLIRFLVGDDIAWVFGEAESDDAARSDDDLRMNGYLAFANGTRAFLRTWPSGAANWTVDIIGETGTLRATGNGSDIEWWQPAAGGILTRRPMPRPQRIESPGVRAVRDLVACIETGKTPECAGEDGVAALETAIALRESHRRGGCRVELPIADRTLGIRSMETLGGETPRRLRAG
jgi:predicted dehydrogenase